MKNRPHISVKNIAKVEELLEASVCTLVSFVGYEKRSTALLRKFFNHKNAKFFCWCFDLSDARHSSTFNRKIVGDLDLQIKEYKNCEPRVLIADIIRFSGANSNSNSRIIVDYSSLPRSVYLGLLWEVLESNMHSRFVFSYIPGFYSKPKVFPCVGVGDWKVLFDRGRIESEFRSTLVGLSYDWTRTYGILDRLNPQEIYCVSVTENKGDAVYDIVNRRNKEIIGMSQNFVWHRIASMSDMYYGVRDLIAHLLHEGDVEVIADGPKPLVMAMHLATMSYPKNGCFLWQISHAHNSSTMDLSEKDSFEIFSFSVDL